MRVRLLGFLLWQCPLSLSLLLSPGVTSEVKWSSQRYRGRSEALWCLPLQREQGQHPRGRLTFPQLHLPKPSTTYLSFPGASCPLICAWTGAWAGARPGGATAGAAGSILGTPSQATADSSSYQNLRQSFGFSPRDPFIRPALTHQLFRRSRGWGNVGRL